MSAESIKTENYGLQVKHKLRTHWIDCGRSDASSFLKVEIIIQFLIKGWIKGLSITDHFESQGHAYK